MRRIPFPYGEPLLRILRSLAFLSLVVLAGACGRKDPVRIGLAGPFSEPRGTSMRIAAELAVSQLNDAGGIRGRPVELVILDDSASSERAAEVARELAADPSVVAVVGHLTSGATLAAAPIYGGTHPVAVVSPSASTPLLTTAGPWIFRVCPTDAAHGAELARWAWERLGARRAAVMYTNDDYGRGVREEFGRDFTELGGEIVTNDPYLDDLPSFAPYLERLRQRGGAAALIIAGTREGAARILATRESMGLDLAVLGADGIVGVEQSGSLADGVYISTPYLADHPGAANASFVQAYRGVAGGRPPDHRGAGTYDAIRLIAEAVESVGPDRTRIRDYLAGVGTRRPAFEGVTGRIAFDENGDVPDKPTVMGIVEGGVLRSAGGS